MNKDLTVGNPEKVLWQFCLPLFGSIIFQQLYNIADSLVAGKFIGENALAAVGNSYEITLIFIAFAFGCNMGCSVVVSKLFGAKDFKGMKTAVYTACIFSAFVCVCLMLIGILGSEALLKLIRTPDEVFADSKLYLDIYAWGLPFVFYYNIATGIFSALGDSKTPFYFLAASSTSNIAVDIWFVKGFNMGVAGVAWATFLCQGISCILAMVVIFRRLVKIEGKEKAPFFDKKILMQIVVIAVPSTLQQSFISLGNIVLKLFMDEPTELAMHTGIIYLKILSPFYFVVSAKLVADGILRGAGLMKNFMVATFTDLILRVVLAFVFSKTALGATGIWCAWPVGWCVATTLSIMFYRRGPWKNGQTAAESSVEMNVD